MSLSVDDDVRGVGVRSGVFAPGSLVSLFRGLAVIAFFGGAAVTGAAVWFCGSMGLDMWGWMGVTVSAVICIFWTFFWCGFLLLLAAIADYIDSRTRFAANWRVE